MHPAWKPREPEWVRLLDGVEFFMRLPTGDETTAAQAYTARIIGGLQDGRATLEGFAFEGDEMGLLTNLDVIMGLGSLIGAGYLAEQVVTDWRGIDDAETGEPVEFSVEALKVALRLGTPEGGPALVEPFLAWCSRPMVPIAADCRRLKALAKWEFGGGGEHCKGCEAAEADCARGGTDNGERCPRAVNAPQTAAGVAAWAATNGGGVWLRAGMSGQISGLDRSKAMDAANALGSFDRAALVRCFAAIEGGAMEAEATKVKAEE